MGKPMAPQPLREPCCLLHRLLMLWPGHDLCVLIDAQAASILC